MTRTTKKVRILCVDDEQTNLFVRTAVLQQFGCDTSSALDQQTALHIVAAQDIDLALIDYHLADGKNGEQLAREIRAIRPKILLVMLSGDMALPESASRCVDEVLQKGSSNPEQLFQTIERLLPGASLKPRRSTFSKKGA